MPYIVTVTERGQVLDEALATPREAREAVRREVDKRIGWQRPHPAVRLLDWADEPNCSIPLPDGTVVEVERVEWPELHHRAGRPGSQSSSGISTSHEEILAAYNREEE